MAQTTKQKAAQQAKPKEAGEGRPIVFLRTHPNYAYHTGNKAVLSKAHTDFLVAGGFARFDDAETAETPTDETR